MIIGQILFIHKDTLKMMIKKILMHMLKYKKINKFKWAIIIDKNKYIIIKYFIKIIYYYL